MDFDQQPICAGGNGGPGSRHDQIGPACGVAGVTNDREGSGLPGQRDGVGIKRIAGSRIKAANASFTQYNLLVAAIDDMFGGLQPLFNLLPLSPSSD